MKKLTIIFLFCFQFVIFSQNIEIRLKEQVAIDLCNFSDLTEGIVDILYLTVDNYWHFGEYSKIFPVFYLITRILPDDINAYCLGGWFLLNGIAPKYEGEKNKEIKKFALEFMKKGIEKKPDDYRLYWEIAWFYYNEKDFESSLEYLKEAEKYTHPFYVENLKAHIYMKQKNFDKALEEWKKIKEKYPERKEIAEKFIEQIKKEKNE